MGFAVSPYSFPECERWRAWCGGCLHDRLLTVGVFYSQQKQAIDNTLLSLRSDKASAETRETDGVVHQNCSFQFESNQKSTVMYCGFRKLLFLIMYRICKFVIADSINSYLWWYRQSGCLEMNHFASGKASALSCPDTLWPPSVYQWAHQDQVVIMLPCKKC